MKKLYLLSFLFLFVSAQSLFGQAGSKSSLTIGVSQTAVYINAPGTYLVYGAFTSNRRSFSGVKGGESLGLSVGYTRQVLPRFEASFRANYTGNTIDERLHQIRGDNVNGEPYDYTFERTRKYRVAYLEGLLFWRVIGPRSKADVQLGAGITYFNYWQEYRSGFEFDVDRGIYNMQAFTKERIGKFGLPLHAQIQYPITPRIKLGMDAFISMYDFDQSVAGLTFFGAYQLGN